MNLKVSYSILLIMFCQALAVNGAYWREWDPWRIPLDAVKGGTDMQGNHTYIGMTIFPKLTRVLPSIIYVNKLEAIASGDRVLLRSSENTLILCADTANEPQWIPMNVTDMFNVTQCHFLQGGHEIGYKLFIGRLLIGDQYITGKVFFEGRYQGLEYHDDTKFGTGVTNFELIGYCPF